MFPLSKNSAKGVFSTSLTTLKSRPVTFNIDVSVMSSQDSKWESLQCSLRHLSNFSSQTFCGSKYIFYEGQTLLHRAKDSVRIQTPSILHSSLLRHPGQLIFIIDHILSTNLGTSAYVMDWITKTWHFNKVHTSCSLLRFRLRVQIHPMEPQNKRIAEQVKYLRI